MTTQQLYALGEELAQAEHCILTARRYVQQESTLRALEAVRKARAIAAGVALLTQADDSTATGLWAAGGTGVRVRAV